MINTATFEFLNELKTNNNRPWFEKNKPRFLDAKTNMEDFMAAINQELNKSDVIDESKIYRIYRDVRFSKDKTPYKSYFSGYLRRAGSERRGGYWISIQPGNTQIGGGFYGPNKDDLFRIRKEFEMDGTPIKKIVENAQFKKLFGQLDGEAVKTATKGFAKETPNIELIRMKQFYAFRKFTDKEVIHPDFVKNVEHTFRGLRPFFDYMSEVLTTDLNGESVLKK
jgi:uncharacterized protein (TIGR02453 family)